MNKLCIQGDVALLLVKLPANAKTAPKGAEVLALGEHSGHGHVAENCEVMVGADDRRFVVPKKNARLLHKNLQTDGPGDHGPVPLALLQEGYAYQVCIQIEFNPEEGVFKQVID